MFLPSYAAVSFHRTFREFAPITQNIQQCILLVSMSFAMAAEIYRAGAHPDLSNRGGASS